MVWLIAFRQGFLSLCLFAFLMRHVIASNMRAESMQGLNAEEQEYAKLYWDYSVDDRVTRPDRATGSASSSTHLTSYRFFVPTMERLAGIAYIGHAARLRLVLQRAAAG